MTTDVNDLARRTLADRFRARIEAVMDEWRAAVADDDEVTAGDSLPRVQLEDHLPDWLAAFADVLAAAPGSDRARAEAWEARDAEVHGLQRWQQGYDLHDVTREWGHLHRCLVLEFERLGASQPALPPTVFAEARLKLAEQISEATSLSAERYFHLERIEAAGSVLDLERALADVRELERRRGELWQQAAHDLRGNLGVVSNVAHGLTFADLPAARRQDFLGLLRNNVVSLDQLLDDVTSLARLQAGQEQRRVGPFDAASELRRLADDLRPLAESRGLYLKVEGPQSLAVEGDAVKVRRIGQNLLLNALKYTRSGGVALSWHDGVPGDTIRWRFTVEDTGPGFHAGPGAPLANALAADAPDAVVAAAGRLDERPISQAQGEGLGLAIVKRLCDLLDASVEFDSTEGRGTTVQVTLPVRYPGTPAP
ncbi:MAG: HAMP domain-containing sensor histidine kinase [Caldimonas sp.]